MKKYLGFFDYKESDTFRPTIESRIHLNYPTSKTICANGIPAIIEGGWYEDYNQSNEEVNMDNLRIRKLTPCETWKLMGFDKSDFEKAEKVNSNTQLYKQAGNSIVVNVLEKILNNLIDKDESIKILELFGGIGACSKAFERLGIEYEIADYVEIDKYAVKSFNAMHDSNFEPQDICDWDKDMRVDLIMHGSPCQDFSIAGKHAGGDKGSGTRSSLMYETIRIVEKLKPKYVIWENVKNIISKKHKHNFDNYIERMKELGYKNYYQVLNAKDYGIPQNRERVFTISIRNDIDKDFNFPKEEELNIKLKDLLDNDVDEKYYLSDQLNSKIQSQLKNKKTDCIDLCQWRREGKPREYNEISPTLSARDYKEPRCVQVTNLVKNDCGVVVEEEYDFSDLD